MDTGQNTMSQLHLELINRPECPKTEAFTSQLVPVSKSFTRSRCMRFSSSSCSIFHHCISSASANWSSSIEFGFSSLPKNRKVTYSKYHVYKLTCYKMLQCYKTGNPLNFCFPHTLKWAIQLIKHKILRIHRQIQ